MRVLPESLRQMGETIGGDMPLIVLTAGQQMAPDSSPFDDRRVPVAQGIIDAQAALAALSLRGEQRVIAESGHQVHLDAPEAVIAAVQDLIQMIK